MGTFGLPYGSGSAMKLDLGKPAQVWSLKERLRYKYVQVEVARGIPLVLWNMIDFRQTLYGSISARRKIKHWVALGVRHET